MKLFPILVAIFIIGLALGIFIPMRSAPRIDGRKLRTQQEMRTLQQALSYHVQEYGTLPTESPEATMVEILSGRNPRKVSFYSATEDKVRDRQLLDDWNRPFIFLKIKNSLEIRSAGKDGILYTFDDLTQDVPAIPPDQIVTK